MSMSMAVRGASSCDVGAFGGRLRGQRRLSRVGSTRRKKGCSRGPARSRSRRRADRGVGCALGTRRDIDVLEGYGGLDIFAGEDGVFFERDEDAHVGLVRGRRGASRRGRRHCRGADRVQGLRGEPEGGMAI